MYLIRKVPVCCMLLLMKLMLWMNPALTEGSLLCCYTILSNGSVNYTQNMMVNFDYSWNNGAIPLSDEQGNANSTIVLNDGTNWILLNKLYFNVNFMSTAPEKPCDSGKIGPYVDAAIPVTDNSDRDKGHGDHGGDEGHGGDGVPDSKDASVAFVSVAFVSIAFVILAIIIWKSGCYRKCCANRPEANHANGGFQAVGGSTGVQHVI
ncbi:hypothetical protein Q7C36_021402 [Tachysurus vachellii]|uniref:Uncharacterized protein n=1 Tax=Tachysurus vachellii TaxID=175792 RepID=A0AA88J159_TACVA|nr:hypothetical protein Q7C36_021402 [Tachysurus vachellii]